MEINTRASGSTMNFTARVPYIIHMAACTKVTFITARKKVMAF